VIIFPAHASLHAPEINSAQPVKTLQRHGFDIADAAHFWHAEFMVFIYLSWHKTA